MSRTMNEKDLEQLKAHVTELAKGLKSEADLSSLEQPGTDHGLMARVVRKPWSVPD